MIAAPSPSNKIIESPQNLRKIREILSETTKEMRKALLTNESAKFVPILQSRNQKLTELLPQLKDLFVSQMVATVIKRSQELVATLSASPDNGIAEVSAFMRNRMHDTFFAYIEHSILDDKQPGNHLLYHIYISLF